MRGDALFWIGVLPQKVKTKMNVYLPKLKTIRICIAKPVAYASPPRERLYRSTHNNRA